MYRTYHLTGMPLVGDSTVMKLLGFAGFRLDYPVEMPGIAIVHAKDLRHPFHLLLGYLFAPTNFNYVSFVWPGNMGALLMLFGIPLFFSRGMSGTMRMIVAGLLPVIAAGLIFALSYGPVNGTAGYYYTFPVTLAILAGCALLWRARPPIKWVLVGVLIAALVRNTLLGFVASSGLESPGAPPPPLSLLNSSAGGVTQRHALIQAEGLAPINNYIEQNFAHDCRAVAIGDWSTTLALPCTVDNVDALARKLIVMKSDSSFLDYLNRAHINLLIAPRFPADTVYYRTAERLRALGLPVVESPAYFAVDLRDLAGHLPKPAEHGTATTAHVGIDLMDLLPQAKAADLEFPTSSRGRLYRKAPRWAEYIAEAPGVMLYGDTALTFALPASAEGRSSVFSTTIGLLPEDTMRDMGPFEFGVRLLAANGRELASHQWLIAAGDNRRVQMPITLVSGVGPLYLELSSRVTGKNHDLRTSLMVAQPRLSWR